MLDEYVSSLTSAQFETALVGALNLNGATSPQQALVALGAGVRPNLLDNAYFVGGGTGWGVFPVNQQGLSVYTGQSKGFDRWKTQFTSYAQLSLLQNGLQIGFSAGTPTTLQTAAGCTQILPHWKQSLTLGQEFVFSVLAEEVTDYINLLVVYSQDSTTKYVTKSFTNPSPGLLSVSGKMPADGTITSVQIYGADIRYGSTTSSYSIISSAKLELGSNQTHAYQDSERSWHRLSQPDMDYGTQLAKCQAFYEESNENVGSRGVSIRVPPNGIIYVPFKVPKRVIPAITVQGNDASYIQTSYITVNGFTAQNSDTVNLRAFDYSATAEL